MLDTHIYYMRLLHIAANYAINLIETVEIKMYAIKSTKCPNQRWDILKNGKLISSTYHSYKAACVLFSQFKNSEKSDARVLAIMDSVFLFGIEYDRQIKEAHHAI